MSVFSCYFSIQRGAPERFKQFGFFSIEKLLNVTCKERTKTFIGRVIGIIFHRMILTGYCYSRTNIFDVDVNARGYN